MIKFEIWKQRPVAAPAPPTSNVLQLPNIKSSSSARYRDKISFIRWLEEEVKPKFSVGDRITFRYNPIIEGTGPLIHGVITYINEIYFQCPLNVVYNEPMAIGTCFSPGNENRVHCPSELRKLTDEEVKYVMLRDSKNTSPNPETD